MNDVKKAIETLKDMKGVFDTRGHKQYSLSALDLAIASLEKQIPKKPNKVFNGTESIPICECGAEVYMFPKSFKGCPYCLQAIDWSVEE